MQWREIAVWHAGTCICEDTYWHCAYWSEMTDLSVRIFLRVLDVYMWDLEYCCDLEEGDEGQKIEEPLTATRPGLEK